MAVILSQHTRRKNIPQAYIEAVLANPAGSNGTRC